MERQQLTPKLLVGPQIGTADLEDLARQGFTDIVCHRPDAEHPEGDTSQIIKEAAEKAGLLFHYLPITPGKRFEQEAGDLSQIVIGAEGKTFAYCRSGLRASNAWWLAQRVC